MMACASFRCLRKIGSAAASKSSFRLAADGVFDLIQNKLQAVCDDRIENRHRPGDILRSADGAKFKLIPVECEKGSAVAVGTSEWMAGMLRPGQCRWTAGSCAVFSIVDDSSERLFQEPRRDRPTRSIGGASAPPRRQSL